MIFGLSAQNSYFYAILFSQLFGFLRAPSLFFRFASMKYYYLIIFGSLRSLILNIYRYLRPYNIHIDEDNNFILKFLHVKVKIVKLIDFKSC